MILRRGPIFVILSLLLALPVSAARRSPPKAVGNTVEERLASLLNGPIAESSLASVQISEVGTNRVLARKNATRPVIPASNLKLLTTAAAFELLGSDFEFVTTLSTRGPVGVGGTLRGDVKVSGRGDPTIGARFHDGKSTAVFEEWAGVLKGAGIRTIEGDLVFEHGYFDSEFVHPTWPVNQLTSWYEAPVAALSLEEGCVSVKVTPGRPGQPAVVRLDPPSSYFQVENTSQTRPGRGAIVTRKDTENTIVVTGQMRATAKELQVYVTVVNPIRYFATVMRETFEARGIEIKGEIRLTGKDDRADWRTLTEYRTPLPVIVFVINKRSQNHYAEMLIKTLGAELRGEGSWDAGAAVLEEWLEKKVKVSRLSFDIIDGSGMSRHNRASAEVFIDLLDYVWKRPWAREFLSSMPYTGEREGRLRSRLQSEPYARQVYAKTGYLSRVIGLSGYIRATSGRVYAFSLLFNNYRSGVWEIYRLQDEILKEVVTGG
jgi:D-alanyl-D-alanine carboxypeptidase/D-alanyl-D-alanine-endopeptidase (penicillin-binding protein 4)